MHDLQGSSSMYSMSSQMDAVSYSYGSPPVSSAPVSVTPNTTAQTSDLFNPVAVQEMQPMVARQTGQARQVQLVHTGLPQLAVSHGEASPNDSALSRIRRRVVWVSVIMACFIAFRIVSERIMAVNQIYNVLDAIQIVVPDAFKEKPPMLSVLISGIPGVSFAVLCGMCVPLCGYFGAKQNRTNCLGCFWGCNACGGCVLCFSIVGGLIFLVGIHRAVPVLEEYIETCDPIVHCPLGAPHGNDRALVDCLLATTWKQYHSPMAGSPLNPQCSKVSRWFLSCGADLAESSRPTMPNIKVVDSFRAQAPTDRFNRNGAFTRSLREREIPALRSPKGKPDLLHLGPTPDKMPANPLEECIPNKKTIRGFHAAKLLIPKIMPKFDIMLVYGLLMEFVMMLLSCLAFCWGKDLYYRVQQGYQSIGGAPALGSNAAVSEEMMAQPLMMNEEHSLQPAVSMHPVMLRPVTASSLPMLQPVVAPLAAAAPLPAAPPPVLQPVFQLPDPITAYTTAPSASAPPATVSHKL